MPKYAVIMPAAGRSSRFRDPHYKKPFAPLAGRAVWLHTAEKFLNRDDCPQLILVVGADDRESFDRKFGANIAILGIDVVEGGSERYESVEKGLQLLRPEIDMVAVHDAARPCVADAWITSVFEKAAETGAAILATPLTSTLKRVGANGAIEETVGRDGLWEAQTPQVFRRTILEGAYANRRDLKPTDDAQLVENAGHSVAVVKGSPINIKITSREDLRLAELALKVLPKPKLDGPAHPFAGDDLWR